jgi:putative DNA primase/helicase
MTQVNGAWLPPVPAPAANSADSGEIDLLRYLHNDHGNAERLIAHRGGDLRFCPPLNKWIVWNGRYWPVDIVDSAREIFKMVMLEFLRQAMRDKSEAAEKFAKASLDSKRITNGLREAQHRLAILPDELDRDPWALNFANCTVDLRTGTARAHARQDYITRALDHEFHPEAKCPRYIRFLEEVTGGGPDAGQGLVERSNHIMDYLQCGFGYSLTAVTTEKAVFIVHGPRDNGKTVLLATWRIILGPYAVVIKIDSLMLRAGQENANAQADLADLRGARFVMTSETEEGQRLAEGKIKQITQGLGKIKAVRKYENPIEFAESHKLWLDANFLPIVRSYDDAIWRRLHAVPFTVIIPRDRQDRFLGEKLLAEAEGILAWGVQGAVRWYQNGLKRPNEIDMSSGVWRREMDRCGAFIDECCDRAEAAEVRAAALYEAYRAWVGASGEKAMSGRAFGLRIKEAGIEKRVDRSGTFYIGLTLRQLSLGLV